MNLIPSTSTWQTAWAPLYVAGVYAMLEAVPALRDLDVDLHLDSRDAPLKGRVSFAHAHGLVEWTAGFQHRGVFVNSPHCVPLFPNAAFTGFPLVAPSKMKRKPVGKIALVPGRIEADRLPGFIYNAAQLLPPEWEVVFCTPYSSAPLPPLPRCRAINVCSHEQYMALLGEASVVVASGVFDTLNIAAIEAISAGVPVVAPAMEPFTGYVTPRALYVPGSTQSLADAIVNAKVTPRYRIDFFIDPKTVGERHHRAILDALKASA